MFPSWLRSENLARLMKCWLLPPHLSWSTSMQHGECLLARGCERQGDSLPATTSGSCPDPFDAHNCRCGPCQMLAPTLSSVSKKLEGQLQVVKIDTDKNPAIATRFNISALPTLVFFRDGKAVDKIEGLLNEGQLLDRLSYLLKAKQT